MSEREFCKCCLQNNKIVLYEECHCKHNLNLTNKEGAKNQHYKSIFTPVGIDWVKRALKNREDLVVSAENYYQDAKSKYEKMLDEYRRIILPEEE